MSFRVIVSGTPTARLVDVECHACGGVIEDVWRDEIPVKCPGCHLHMGLIEVFRRSPMMDFNGTSPIVVPNGKNPLQFSSYTAMEKWQGRHNKSIMTPSQWEQIPSDTPEERIEKKNGIKRKEAIAKTAYKLKHGYLKPAVHPKEIS
jgi:hypothetical protein